MGRRAGQEVNNCVTSPWPGSRVELSSGLYRFNNPHLPTVPRMIVREQSRYFRGHGHSFSLCHFLLIPLLRENHCGNFVCKASNKISPLTSYFFLSFTTETKSYPNPPSLLNQWWLWNGGGDCQHHGDSPSRAKPDPHPAP